MASHIPNPPQRHYPKLLLLASLVVALSLSLLWPRGAHAHAAPNATLDLDDKSKVEIIAFLDKQVITSSDVERRFKLIQAIEGDEAMALASDSALRQKVIETLVDEAMVIAEGRDRGLLPDDREVEAMTTSFLTSKIDQAQAIQLRDNLDKNQLIGELKQTILSQLIIRKILQGRLDSQNFLTTDEIAEKRPLAVAILQNTAPSIRLSEESRIHPLVLVAPRRNVAQLLQIIDSHQLQLNSKRNNIRQLWPQVTKLVDIAQSGDMGWIKVADMNTLYLKALESALLNNRTSIPLDFDEKNVLIMYLLEQDNIEVLKPQTDVSDGEVTAILSRLQGEGEIKKAVEDLRARHIIIKR